MEHNWYNDNILYRSSITSIFFIDDDRLIVSGYDYGIAMLHNRRCREEIFRILDNKNVSKIVVNKNKSLIVASCEDDLILFNLNSFMNCHITTESAENLTLSDCGNFLAFSNRKVDYLIEIIDMQNWPKIDKKLISQNQYNEDLAFSSDGLFLASAGNLEIEIWDFKNEKIHIRFAIPDASFHDTKKVKYSSYYNCLFLLCENRLYAFCAMKYNLVKQIDLGEELSDFCFDHLGQIFILGIWGNIFIWDFENNVYKKIISFTAGNWFTVLAVHNNSLAVGTTVGYIAVYKNDN